MTEDKHLLSGEDEQMLQAFFADQKLDIADDGFSDKVMEKLPYAENRRLVRCWQIVCVLIGVALLVVGQVWGNLQDMLLASKVEGAMALSRIACRMGEAVVHSQNLLMYLAGVVILLMVWGYNEVLDARYK